ncbi:MAG: ABC transporter ATP-binding protein [Spirochaetales bacterium]|nr:ABC transporter ATP-binding protein [Spirochaetales bacterium]
MNTIKVENLTKTFVSKTGKPFRKKKGELRAVDVVSFTIPKGEIFSLLGPNGAGKTTTIKILATLLIPSGGSASVMGHDVVKQDFAVRKVLTAVLPGERTLYWKLSVKENLLYFASLYGMSQREAMPVIKQLLADFELEDKENSLVEKLSTGQRQKAVLCRALLPGPEVILLDEPTLGLDPVSAKNLRAIIKRIQEKGTTILLTTHYMFEADELSDRVAIIDAGKIVCLDTPQNLKKNLNVKKIFRLETNRWTDKISESISLSHGIQSSRFYRKNGHYSVELEVAQRDLSLSGLSTFCSNNDISIHQVSIDEPTLEDVFVEKTGKTISEAEDTHEAPVLA